MRGGEGGERAACGLFTPEIAASRTNWSDRETSSGPGEPYRPVPAHSLGLPDTKNVRRLWNYPGARPCRRERQIQHCVAVQHGRGKRNPPVRPSDPVAAPSMLYLPPVNWSESGTKDSPGACRLFSKTKRSHRVNLTPFAESGSCLRGTVTDPANRVSSGSLPNERSVYLLKCAVSITVISIKSIEILVF